MRGLVVFGRLFSLWLVVASFAGCADYGQKVERLEGEVFYTKSVSKSEADTLANWLVFVGYFDSITRKSVQLDRSGDTCHVRFVIHKEFRETPEVERFMILAAYEMSRAINDGHPTVSHICNDRFESQAAVPLNLVNKGGELIYTNRINTSEAQQLAEFLYTTEFFSDSAIVTVLIDRDLDRYLFKMISQEGVAEDEHYRELAAEYARSMSEQLFDNAPVDFYFVNSMLATEAAPVYFAN